MARLNLEYKLLSDPRFKALSRKIGERLAIGEWVAVAMAAQDYWAKDKSLIPTDIWVLNEFSEDLIRCHLVEKKDDGYYLKGSEEYFNWYLKMLEFGKKGVEARKLKAEKRAEDKENELLNLEISQHTVNPPVDCAVNCTVNSPVDCTVNPPTPTPTPYNIYKKEKPCTVNSPVDCTVNPPTPTPTPYNIYKKEKPKQGMSDEEIKELLPGLKEWAFPFARRMTAVYIKKNLRSSWMLEDVLRAIEDRYLRDQQKKEKDRDKNVNAGVHSWLRKGDDFGTNSDSSNNNRATKVNNGGNRHLPDPIGFTIVE